MTIPGELARVTGLSAPRPAAVTGRWSPKVMRRCLRRGCISWSKGTVRSPPSHVHRPQRRHSTNRSRAVRVMDRPAAGRPIKNHTDAALVLGVYPLEKKKALAVSARGILLNVRTAGALSETMVLVENCGRSPIRTATAFTCRQALSSTASRPSWRQTG